jgi:type II secretory pathway component GspD/PulD (secretin)
MRLAVFVFAAVVSFAQTSRTFPVTQAQADLKQIAALLRHVAGVARISIDETNRTVIVDGAAGQIAASGWLLQQLDLPGDAALSGPREYRPPLAGDDVVRVFYATHAPQPRQLQYIATAIRSLGDIRRLYTYGPLGAVAVRGTREQVSLATWLLDHFNLPPNTPAAAPEELKLSGGEVARVFQLAWPQTVQGVQEIVTTIRSIADLQRVVDYPDRRAVAVRAPAERVALASWLVSELEQPPDGQSAAPDPRAHEYRFPSGPDNLVRIFYLSRAQSPADRQKVVTQVRTTTRIPRLFVYNALGALVARGTAGQIATAERVLEEIKAPVERR